MFLTVSVGFFSNYFEVFSCQKDIFFPFSPVDEKSTLNFCRQHNVLSGTREKSILDKKLLPVALYTAALC